MKRVKIVIPKNQDDATAQWLAEKAVRVLLSYSQSDFWDLQIVIICGVPDEVLEEFKTHFTGKIK